MSKQVCYCFTSVNDVGCDTDDKQVLAVDVTINHDRSDCYNWDADLVIGVRSKINKEWVTEDFGFEPFDKETAIALRDFLIFCFPLKGSL